MTKFKIKNFICTFVAFALMGSFLPIAQGYADEVHDNSEVIANAGDDGSDLHVQNKDIFATDKVDFTNIPVIFKNSAGEEKTYPQNDSLQIWNATTQENEGIVKIENGIIPKLSLINGHNYVIYPYNDIENADRVFYSSRTYVWVREGKLVSTKSLKKESVASRDEWSYPEVGKIVIDAKDGSTGGMGSVYDASKDVRRHLFQWPVLSSGNYGNYQGLTFKFSSDVETLEAQTVFSSNETTVSARLLEDVNYTVSVESANSSLGLEPFPICYKDKSEYPESLSDYWPKASTYDHRCCYQIRYFDLVPKRDLHSGYDEISTDDGLTTVRGFDFFDERTSRIPVLKTQISKTNKAGLTGDFDIVDIKAVNTARGEVCKINNNEFTISQKVANAKYVQKIYEINGDKKTEITGFRQVGDVVTFKTNSLSVNSYGFVYGADAPANFSNVLSIKVQDSAGNPVKGAQLKINYDANLTRGSINIPKATDNYGQVDFDISSENIMAGDDYTITHADGSKITITNPAAVVFGDDGGYYVETVNDEDYAGQVNLTASVPADLQVLNVKVVDGVGNPVRGVELKLKANDLMNPSWKNKQFIFSSPTNAQGVTSFSLPEDESDAGNYEGDWTLTTTSTDDGNQTTSPYKLKEDKIVTVEENDDFQMAFSYVGNDEYAGLTQIVALVPCSVTYSMGGHSTDVYVSANVGDKLTNPANPTAKGFKFDGWYKDSTFKTPWDFANDVVTGDMILYAKWSKSANPITVVKKGVGNVSYTKNSGKLIIQFSSDKTSSNTIMLPKAVKVTSGSKTIYQSTSLVNKSKWQTANSEYKRRMKENVKMTTFDSVVKAAKSQNNLTINNVPDGAVINFEFEEVVPVYRLYNIITSEHLFTTDKAEYDNWVAIGKTNKDFWIGEGIDWLAPKSGKNVYRLYNPGLGALGKSSHYYTSDEKEIKSLTSKYGWKKETQFAGAGGSVFQSGGSQAIYTCYNEALRSAHHYTSSKTEWQGLKMHGWDLETKKNGTSGFFQCVTSAK